MATRFTKQNTVEKKPLTKMCEQTHVKQMLKNVDLIKQAGIKIAEYRVDDGILVSSYIQKPILEDVIRPASYSQALNDKK